MADETPDTTEEQKVEAVEAAKETAAEQPAPATEDAPAEAPAAEADAADAPEAEAEAPAPAEPVVPQTPKERKAAARARRGKRRPSTPEERAELRKQKAAARTRYRAKRREKDRAARGEAGPAKTVSPVEHGPGSPKERLGTVVSDKADKTIVVRIDTARRHRRYQKIVRSSTTLHAHDEANDANTGDLVKVVESRPLSRTKRWRLVEILERAK
ncbi:MAG: 30S ribosomal protein S17 [Solirubrobacterales bacterium]|nr:30S ribosomal protein S17 [Solirubrobacterales bacterium]